MRQSTPATALIALAILMVSGCTDEAVQENGSSAQTNQTSATREAFNGSKEDFCVIHEGMLGFRTLKNGTLMGMCTLKDGNACELEEYMSGECPKKTGSAKKAQSQFGDIGRCAFDVDCGCGYLVGGEDCVPANKAYLDANRTCQGPDCYGMRGTISIKCIAGQCEQVSADGKAISGFGSPPRAEG
jgi:putative hemolysin